jgi:hypothetical protein
MSLRDVAITMIWFQPLFAWLGLLTLLSLLTTASYGYMLFKGKVRSFRTHMMLAATTITLAIIHATLALSTLI